MFSHLLFYSFVPFCLFRSCLVSSCFICSHLFLLYSFLLSSSFVFARLILHPLDFSCPFLLLSNLFCLVPLCLHCVLSLVNPSLSCSIWFCPILSNVILFSFFCLVCLNVSHSGLSYAILLCPCLFRLVQILSFLILSRLVVAHVGLKVVFLKLENR